MVLGFEVGFVVVELLLLWWPVIDGCCCCCCLLLLLVVVLVTVALSLGAVATGRGALVSTLAELGMEAEIGSSFLLLLAELFLLVG